MNESRKNEFSQSLIEKKNDILKSALNVFREIAIECHTFGSIARGDSDELSDIDVWFTVKDSDIEDALAKRLDYYSRIGDIVHICEPPQNAPINGVHSFIIFKVSNQLVPVDLYICPLSTSFQTKEASHIFGEAQIPFGEISFNLQKVSVPESYRLDFLICFIFNAIKRVVREKSDALDGLLTQYDKLKDSNNMVEALHKREPSFDCLYEIIEKIRPFSNDRQKLVLGEISNFINQIKINFAVA